MKIERIYIENYRSIKKLELKELNNLVVFVGENNSGKSTVLNAIKCIHSHRLNENIIDTDVYHGSNTLKIGIVKRPNYRFYKVVREKLRRNEHLLYSNLVEEFSRGGRNINTIAFDSEMNKKIKKHFFNRKRLDYVAVVLEYDKDTNRKKYYIADTKYRKQANLDNQELEFILPLILNEPAVIEDERGFKSESENGEDSLTNKIFSLFIQSLNESVENSTLEELEEKPASSLSIGELNKILNSKIEGESDKFLNHVNYSFQKNYSESLEFKWTFNTEIIRSIPFNSKFRDRQGNYSDFLSVGSGTRTIFILSLFEALIESTNTVNQLGLFLIEEPELYLYPRLEEKMGDILLRLSTDNQVFITTHSGGIASYFNQDNVYTVEKTFNENSSQSSFSRLTKVEELINLLGFNSFPFFKKDYVIFVEGPSDVDGYKRIFEAFYPGQVDRIAFLHVNGINNMRVSLITQLLENTELKNKFCVFVDSDGRDKETIYKKLNSELQSFMTKRDGVKPRERERELRDRLYVTENSTNIETLSYCYENQDHQDLETKVEKFIDDYEGEIKKSIIDRKSQKVLPNEMCENSKYQELKEMGTREKFESLKKFFLTKKLHKKFKDSINYRSLTECSSDEIEKLAPELVKIIHYINSEINGK